MPDTDLYPTKTRLQLLRDCADGNVRLDSVTGDSYLDVPGEPQRKVTTRVDELDRAGWVDLETWPGKKWKPTPTVGDPILKEHTRA